MTRGRLPRCHHAHPIGYITNQPERYDSTRAHASTYVCAREACQDDAKRWVRDVTGEKGVLVLFPTGTTHTVITPMRGADAVAGPPMEAE